MFSQWSVRRLPQEPEKDLEVTSPDRRCHWWPTFLMATLSLIFPLAAYAQVGGSPFDSGFTALETLFTGTIARVASLIAIVIGGYGFAHGEPGAKKALAGVAAGTGIAVLAVNVLSWLWGV
ncbi:MAG TPA: TrbC/VirB2 family protein [Acidobacteriaceae bacterium]|nr:TrbC/VirB2 family protein [Acidobacteriaceae bacterium]